MSCMSWGRSCAGISADWVEIGARFLCWCSVALGGSDLVKHVWCGFLIDGGDVGVEFSCDLLCRTLLNSSCLQDDHITFPLFDMPISSSV